jgi:hypothetical protein
MEAREVSFTRLMNELDSGGIDTLDACGRIILLSVCE